METATSSHTVFSSTLTSCSTSLQASSALTISSSNMKPNEDRTSLPSSCVTGTTGIHMHSQHTDTLSGIMTTCTTSQTSPTDINTTVTNTTEIKDSTIPSGIHTETKYFIYNCVYVYQIHTMHK